MCKFSYLWVCMCRVWVHIYINVVIFTTFSSLVVLKVVKIKTISAASDQISSKWQHFRSSARHSKLLSRNECHQCLCNIFFSHNPFAFIAPTANDSWPKSIITMISRSYTTPIYPSQVIIPVIFGAWLHETYKHSTSIADKATEAP